MINFSLPISESYEALQAAARERILILDGAMGTMIQTLNMTEEDFTAKGHIHGPGCRHHHSDHPQKGNNDLLVLTQPQAVEDIQLEFALAGADILETNTFSSTTIAQADYGLEDAVHDLNVAGAQGARRGPKHSESTLQKNAG